MHIIIGKPPSRGERKRELGWLLTISSGRSFRMEIKTHFDCRNNVPSFFIILHNVGFIISVGDGHHVLQESYISNRKKRRTICLSAGQEESKLKELYFGCWHWIGEILLIFFWNTLLLYCIRRQITEWWRLTRPEVAGFVGHHHHSATWLIHRTIRFVVRDYHKLIRGDIMECDTVAKDELAMIS